MDSGITSPMIFLQCGPLRCKLIYNPILPINHNKSIHLVTLVNLGADANGADQGAAIFQAWS